MADKWRFDPNRDYTSDEYGDGDNYQRFNNRGKKNRHGDGESYTNNKKKDRRHNRSDSWR